MKKFKKNVFLLFLISGVLSLSSCGCFGRKQVKATLNIPETIENGSLKVVNLSRKSGDFFTEDTLRIIPKADEGYKLKSLKINGDEVQDFNRVKLGKSETNYSFEVEFEQFNETKYQGNFDAEKRTTYETVMSTIGDGTIPNRRASKILVVPVEYSDVSAFTNQELQNLESCFNGTNPDGTNDYWESVSSFYKKSSYGNVNLDFVITDPFKTSMSSRAFINYEKVDGQGTFKLLDSMYDNITISGSKVDYSQYDSNNDGYVDGVWMIHNYRDKKGVFKENNFWAYCYVKYNNTPNIIKPTFSRYANCSQAFLYQGNTNSLQYGNDAHTLIHETGHMFGLDDYYSYDEINSNRGKEQIIGSTGGIDMMDLNIGDHNAFSKFSLGWVNPHMVQEDTDIYLRPFQETGECLVIPVKPTMTSAFNEYIIIEYYTPTMLNELDANTNYNGRYPKLYQHPGLKIFHINAYLANHSHLDVGDVCDELLPYNEINRTNQRTVGLSNTASRNHFEYEQDGKHNLIEAITPDNIRTYGNNFLGVRNGVEQIRGLFEVGDVFNYKCCSNFFIEGKKLHNRRYEFPWSIRVENLYNDKAAISIKKIS